MEIVLRVARNDIFQIGDGGREIVQLNLGHAAPIDRMKGIVPGSRDRLAVTLTRPGKLAFVEVDVAQFFIIARCRVYLNQRLKVFDSLLSRKGIERVAEKCEVRNDFKEYVDERAQRTEKYHDPQ